MKPESYKPPEFENEIRLQLSRNESCCVFAHVPSALAGLPAESSTRYPSMDELQSGIGDFVGVNANRIVVSAGGDQALERVIRLGIQRDGKTILTHTPSFEMVDIYTHNHGGNIAHVPWVEDEFPTSMFIDRLDNETGVAILCSPNNPTGLTIPTSDILKIADAAAGSNCRLLVDNAYVEFADEDPTEQLAAHSNIILLRTFSKAFGLAGLRVGYLVAPDAESAKLYRAAAGPYPVSGVSIATAERAVTDRLNQMQANVDLVCQSRSQLAILVQQCGGKPGNSQGNFLLCEFEDPESIWQQLAKDGIAVRKFPGSEFLKNKLRITCPTNATDFLHLAKSLIRATGSDFQIGDLDVLTAPESSIQTTVSEPTESLTDRTATVNRETKETKIDIELNLDGTGKTEIETGIGFLDHMLTALAFHSRMDLSLKCVGDLHIDDHHTAEDCALALGAAIDQALGPRTGIVRFGYAYAPLDEAVARTVIDLSGRPWPEIHLDLEREMVGTIATENITHVFTSLAMALRCSLHVDVLRGTNDHHRAEAAFKSLALALRKALARTSGSVPSTKGVL